MTAQPLEIYGDRVWEILNPADAQVVAIFYGEAEARSYLAWRNGTAAPPDPLTVGSYVVVKPRYATIVKMGWKRVTVRLSKNGKIRKLSYFDIRPVTKKGVQ